MRLLLIIPVLYLLGACSFVGFPGVYKIDVEQGNIVTDEMAEQLRPGMSKRQVRFILGTPLVEDTFNPDRWDYIYVKRNGQNVLSESSLSVVFEGDSLSQVSGDFQPTAWQETPEVAEEPAEPEEPEEPEEPAVSAEEASDVDQL